MSGFGDGGGVSGVKYSRVRMLVVVISEFEPLKMIVMYFMIFNVTRVEQITYEFIIQDNIEYSWSIDESE